MNGIVNIGCELARQRRVLRLTQEEVGRRVGVKRQQIQRWEASGYRTASLARVAQVAQALGWSPSSPAVVPVPPVSQVPGAAEAPGSYGSTIADLAVVPVRDLGEIVARIRGRADELRRLFGVTRVAVFGSFARGEQTDESDVDLIVEFERPTMSNVFGAERWLVEVLGRRAESGPLDSVNPGMRAQVEKDLVNVC